MVNFSLFCRLSRSHHEACSVNEFLVLANGTDVFGHSGEKRQDKDQKMSSEKDHSV